MLRDLTAEVNRMKAECAALSEESREVKFSLLLSSWLLRILSANVINYCLLQTAHAGEK